MIWPFPHPRSEAEMYNFIQKTLQGLVEFSKSLASTSHQQKTGLGDFAHQSIICVYGSQNNN